MFCLGFIFRKKGWGKKALSTGLIFLFFFSNTVILSEFSRLWEIHGKKISKLGNYDCAIVLTGMASYNNDINRLELGRNGDRIWQAMDLYKRKKVKKILISGDSGYVSDRGLHEAEQLAEVLLRNGIPKEDIFVEGNSQNTYENARETAKIIKRKPELKKLLLITNSTHMRRSLACFKKQGLVCSSFSVGMLTGPKRSYFFDQYFLPDVNVLERWETITKEWIGYVMYKMMGYL